MHVVWPSISSNAQNVIDPRAVCAEVATSQIPSLFFTVCCKVHSSLCLLFLCFIYNKLKVKAKCTLVQALRLCTDRTAHRGSRGIALLFLDHGTRRGEGSTSRPGRFLPPGKTRYPHYGRLVGP